MYATRVSLRRCDFVVKVIKWTSGISKTGWTGIDRCHLYQENVAKFRVA